MFILAFDIPASFRDEFLKRPVLEMLNLPRKWARQQTLTDLHLEFEGLPIKFMGEHKNPNSDARGYVQQRADKRDVLCSR